MGFIYLFIFIQKLFSDQVSYEDSFLCIKWIQCVIRLLKSSTFEMKSLTFINLMKLLQNHFSSDNVAYIESSKNILSWISYDIFEGYSAELAPLFEPLLIQFMNDIFHWKFRNSLIVLLQLLFEVIPVSQYIYFLFYHF